MSDLYGWYDSPDQPIDQPSHDPPRDGDCPYCGLALTEREVRTHSFMQAVPRPRRSYFYRTHRSCDEVATEQEKESILLAVIARVEADGQV